jgi:hypothetical protein
MKGPDRCRWNNSWRTGLTWTVGGQMSRTKVAPKDALKTYRYVRLGIIGAVLLLGVAMTIEAFSVGDCLQTSISAYYYTPVRAIFVGTLMAIGLALIVIKGPPLEDTSLNIAGMFAPVVAIVPTSGTGGCWSVAPKPDPLDGEELAPWVVANIENNFYALVVAGVVGLAVAGWLAYRDRRMDREAGSLERNIRRSAFITGAILLISFLLLVVWDDFKEVAHYGAAILMFVALNIAVIAEARERKESSRRYFLLYSWLAWLMSLGGVVVWASSFLLGIKHHVLIIEAWEILMFTAFWVVQTVDNWHEEAGPANGYGIREGSPVPAAVAR